MQIIAAFIDLILLEPYDTVSYSQCPIISLRIGLAMPMKTTLQLWKRIPIQGAPPHLGFYTPLILQNRNNL